MVTLFTVPFNTDQAVVRSSAEQYDRYYEVVNISF